MPPTGNAAAGPLFRSITPTKSSVRVFPNLNNIVKNTKNTWEVLPKTPRTMNFRFTVRDNDVNGGRSSVDAMKITVADGDPFLVTHPDTSKITWIGGQNQTIKWNIGNTSISPINTPQVMVLLSTDGGYTYPDTLAQAIPNTGSAVVRVPETATTKARIKIKGVNNIFFDISNNDFTIQKPLFPTFIFSTAKNEAKICQIQNDSISFNLSVGSISNFKNQINLSIKHLPNNAKVSFSQDTITPSGQVNITIYDLKKASAGVYDLFIHGKSGILVDSIPFKLSLFDEINTKVQTLRPSLFEKGFGVKTPFKWNKVQNADNYVIEISSNEKFQPIVETGISSDTQYIAKNLAQTQIYYWRIKAVNTCNESIVTSPIAFQTSALFCDTTSTDVAVSIPTTVADVSSKVEITRKGFLADIDVYTRIDHTSLSDLEVNLQNPNGEEITLFSGVCEDKNHADATFDDNGGVVTCSTGSVTLKGRFKPKESLSIYNNTNVRGNWVLLIKDRVAANGGTLKNWNIRVCTDITPDAGLIVETDTLIVKDGETKNIGEELIVSTSGSANQTPDKINYRIVALPKNGILKKGSTTLLVGSIISQQEINTGAFFYSHDKNSVELRDTFYFETTSAAGGWIPNSPFFVKIRKNNFKVGYTVIDSIKCFGGNEAKISINTIGGKTPLTYSLNGSSFQSDSVFQNLKAGKYEISVKDSEDFISIENFEIKQPLAISTSIPKDSSNILINISGGTSPYEINFDNKGFSTINSFPNQANGWHTFVIRDANGCEFKDSINLAVNTLKATITVKEPLCNGASNGAITVDAIGGRAPYDFQLNKSAFQDNGLFPNLFSGAYTITVKDADGFVRSFFVKVTEPASIVINTNQKQDTLVLNPIGGVAPFQYSINDGVTFQSSPVFPKTPNGNYTLVVKDANDCTAKKSFQFTAVKNIATEYGINISPNPTNDFINIQIKRVLDKNITVAVLNVEGRIVKQSNIATGQNVLTMDIKDLSIGTYYVVLKNADFEFSSKILVIK
jgi:subtilisin-like proprotein convertase family protein